MKKDFTNRKVVNSIGIGFLAMITSGTPVLAALNNAMNENEAADQTMETDLPTDAAAATQNAEIMDVLTGTQEVIQKVQDELNQQEEDFGSRSEENVQEVVPPAEGGAATDQQPPAEPSDTQQPPAEPEGSPEEMPPTEPADTQQPPVEPEGSPEEMPPTEPADTQQPPAESEGQDTENTPQAPQEEVPPVDTEAGAEPETPDGNQPGTPDNADSAQPDSEPGTEEKEEVSPTIDDYLEETKNAVEKIKTDIEELDKKNQEAADAVEDYKDAVANPNDYIGSIADSVSDASSQVVDAVASVTEDEKTAREQAQIAVDAQAKTYESSEAAAAAKEQAKLAADAAEEAYKSAQATVEEAEKHKKTADERLTDLERQLAIADASLHDMQIKVQDAQEMLLSILEEYGLTPGEFDPENLSGAAGEAYKNAQKALELAKAELAGTQNSYQDIAAQVEAASNDFKEAEQALNESNQSMENAVLNLENKRKEWEESRVDELISVYNGSVIGTERVYFTLEDTEKALQNAKDALNEAKEIKENADDVLANAEAAVEAAKKEETLKAEEAAESAKEAAEAIQKNLEDEETIKKAESAKASAEEAAEAVQRALKCLGSAEKTAEQAQKDLEQATEDFDKANTNYEQAQKVYDEAKEAFEQIQESAIKTQIEAVKNAQIEFDSNKGEGTRAYALAKELILFQLISDGKGLKEVKAGEKKEKSREIIVTDTEGVEIKYWFNIDDEKLTISAGTEVYTSIDVFKREVETFKNECEEKEKFLESAQSDLATLNEKLTAASEAKDKAQITKILVDMNDALEAVQHEAEALVKAEKELKDKNNESKLMDTLSTKLNNLIEGGTKLDQAKSTLENVTDAQAELEAAIKKLGDLSAQEEWDQEAYDHLLAEYNRANTDHAAAVEALQQCVSGLNRTKTQKDRARIAANAIFDFISDKNENPTNPTPPETNQPTTPTPPETNQPTTPMPPETNQPTTPAQPVNPIRPIYGTLIDNVTSPIISNPRVPAGTGYVYTVGGQRTYTAPAGETPEGAAAPENLVSVEEGAVPLAEVGKNNKDNTSTINNKKTTRTVSDEKVPLADIETEDSRASWLWILLIALLGATGTELYIRHKEKTEQERKLKGNKKGYAKI
ncbi:hypothetical protein [Schaedlerella arabinosiphila]|uniref:hypothetical protein n=1 Tax=Schaedlerella arabinosiphila TaxID=2044587 RepID=UPI002557FBD8|nr:hypothetical protein [Schaedlerella arabinosiphila]